MSTETETAIYDEIERDLITVDRLILGSREAGVFSAILCTVVIVIGAMTIADLWPPRAIRSQDSAASPSS